MQQLCDQNAFCIEIAWLETGAPGWSTGNTALHSIIIQWLVHTPNHWMFASCPVGLGIDLCMVAAPWPVLCVLPVTTPWSVPGTGSLPAVRFCNQSSDHFPSSLTSAAWLQLSRKLRTLPNQHDCSVHLLPSGLNMKDGSPDGASGTSPRSQALYNPSSISAAQSDLPQVNTPEGVHSLGHTPKSEKGSHLNYKSLPQNLRKLSLDPHVRLKVEKLEVVSTVIVAFIIMPANKKVSSGEKIRHVYRFSLILLISFKCVFVVPLIALALKIYLAVVTLYKGFEVPCFVHPKKDPGGAKINKTSMLWNLHFPNLISVWPRPICYTHIIVLHTSIFNIRNMPTQNAVHHCAATGCVSIAIKSVQC